MLIHLEKLGKSFGEKVVLHDVSASVEKEDRIGIVGQNGAGKTTLLKILTGVYTDYDGEFSVTHGVTLGYLEQNAKLDVTLDIYGEMRSSFAPVLDAMAQMQILEKKMAASPDDAALLEKHDELQNIIDAADGYNMDVNIKKVLSGMGFAQDTWSKNVGVLSGGELTRLRLAKLLLEKPDVLILDEPTNHLDFATMEWLENYLKGYSGAVLVVSHDRYFLDNVCTRIWEVSFQTMTTYKGNFSAYLPQKEAADALRQKQHDADVALAEKLQDYIDRNLVRASTTKMAQSRRRQLEKLEITEAPQDETNQLKFRFEYDVEPWNELVLLKNLTIKIGDRTLLEPFTYTVCRGQRLIIAGPNGAGKTTLLKILTGVYTDYDGEFSVTHGVTLGYLEQNAKLDVTLDIYGEMRSSFAPVLDAMAQMQILEKKMAASPDDAALLEKHDELQNIIDAADGYNMDVNIKKVLSGMGFAQDTWSKNVGVLSGGELTRLRLAKLLLEKPDVLILDEPTNHLDFATMEWLENYLKGYSGAVLVVSHDRYFLDNVCTRIWEVSFQTMTTYKGNFSAYLPQKEAADALRQKQHDADVALAEKLQDYIDRNLVRASTTKMAQSRRRQLEKLEITEAPQDETNQLKFRFEYDVEPWNELVLLKNLTIKIGDRTLLEPFTYTVCRGQRLIIAGPNGAGKSTLMQVLDGKRRPSGGMVRLGTGARPSIFAQQQNRIGAGRVIDVIWNKYPRMTELEVRSHLAKLGFRGETVFKPCEALSGGELARLRFAEIVLERPNLLFLDEPTNHLDIYTRENLTEALMAYTGTLLLVTHDRHLMNSLACPILYLEDGKAVIYPSYDALMGRAAPAPVAEKSSEPAKAGYGKEQRRRRAELRAKIKACEDEMEACGAREVELENEINSPEVYNDPQLLREKSDELSDLRFHQDELFAAWEAAVEEQEQYEQTAGGEE